MQYSIYKILNKENNKCYIGYTKKPINDRFKEHIREAIGGSNKHLKRAIRKYGIETFEISPIETTTNKQKALELEIFYISKFNSKMNGYNMTSGGEGSDWSKGLTYDEMYSREVADKMREKMFGDNNPSVKNDVSGVNNGFYGKQHSCEAKEKIGQSSKTRVCSEKTRKLISEQKIGENNPMKEKTGFKHHSSRAYIIYNPHEDKEYLFESKANVYLRDYGLTLKTLLNRMQGILPKRNKEKYEKTLWRIYEVRRIKI